MIMESAVPPPFENLAQTSFTENSTSSSSSSDDEPIRFDITTPVTPNASPARKKKAEAKVVEEEEEEAEAEAEEDDREQEEITCVQEFTPDPLDDLLTAKEQEEQRDGASSGEESSMIDLTSSIEDQEKEEETSKEEEIDEDDEILVFLNSRKDQNRNMHQRKALLFNFISHDKKRICDHFHRDLRDNQELCNLEFFLRHSRKTMKETKNSKKKRAWSVALVAQKLRIMWKYMEISDSLNINAKRASSPEVGPVKDFRKFMEGVKCRLEQDKAIEIARINTCKKKGSGMKGQSGKYIQDDIKKIENWADNREGTPCPSCNHTMLVAFPTKEELNKETARLKKQYEQMKRTSAALDCRIKLKPPKFPKQFYACMCVVNKCRDKVLGTGCIICEGYAEGGAGAALYDKHMRKCVCHICNCTCDITFPVSQLKMMYASKIEDSFTESTRKKGKTATGKFYLSTTYDMHYYTIRLLLIQFVNLLFYRQDQ
jgi:hypothetical protein